MDTTAEKHLINGKPVVITIARSYGAGGRGLGRMIADELDIPYYDREIIKKAEEETGVSEKLLEMIDGTSPNPTGNPHTIALDADGRGMEKLRHQFEEALNSTLKKCADQGSCVIVGRKADRILRETYPVFSIFVTADWEDRVRNICARVHCAPGAAETLIKETDKTRATFYNFSASAPASTLCSGGWGQAENYDLCVNISKIPTEKAVQFICDMVRSRDDKTYYI